MELNVIIKAVNAGYMIFPVCQRSKVLANMLGKKVFSSKDILDIKSLGFILKIKTEV